jgi:ZIP family zinc transporter
MSTTTIVVLGAFSGLTIFLGLPLAFVRGLSRTLKIFFNMLATGILVFLLYDVLSKASEPVSTVVDAVRAGKRGSVGLLVADLTVLVVGLTLGLLGLVYFQKLVRGRRQPSASTPVAVPDTQGGVQLSRSVLADLPPGVLVPSGARALPAAAAAAPLARDTASVAAPVHELSPQTLALTIATGIGLHNFAEGLAIGQSAAAGALQLALVLVLGFGLHNMTEGFGIAGPLFDCRTSWQFLALAGLIGGGPTFLGTVVGITLHSPTLFLFCLALAAGSILYVIVELVGGARRFKAPEVVLWGMLAGFLLGYLTDVIVSLGGA